MKLFPKIFILLLSLLILPLFTMPAFAFEIGVEEFNLHDANRDKDLPIRVSYPVNARLKDGFPVIIFSHGAYGSRNGYEPLVEYWAEAGFVVIQPTHEDSVSLGNRFGSPLVFRFWDSRPLDISFIIDELDVIEARLDDLPDGFNLEEIGMVGHSFGAQTAELIAGATTYQRPRHPQSYADERVKAIIVISPAGTSRLFREESFAEMRLPMLFITGDNDTTSLTDATPESRMEAYNFSAAGDKYMLWVNDANHNFGGISGVRYPGVGEMNGDHVEIVQQMTLGFWQRYLTHQRGDNNFNIESILPANLRNQVELSHR